MTNQDTTSIDEQREIEKLIALPHIQEFYNWCNEEDIPEDIMYKIAGWLGSEIYFMPANVAVIIQKHISDQVAKARIDELRRLAPDEPSCVCQLADIKVCDHNWSLCNVIKDRIATLNGVKKI